MSEAEEPSATDYLGSLFVVCCVSLSCFLERGKGMVEGISATACLGKLFLVGQGFGMKRILGVWALGVER